MRCPVGLYVRNDVQSLTASRTEINCQTDANFRKLIARDAALLALAASLTAK
jgi:hypothetical protein